MQKFGIPDDNGMVELFSADSITIIDKNGKECFYDLDKIKYTGQKVVDNKSKPITDSSVSLNDGNISQSSQNIKSDKSSVKYSMQKDTNNVSLLKEKQNEIIQTGNLAEDDYHTWNKYME